MRNITQLEQINYYFQNLSKSDKILFKQYVTNFNETIFTYDDILAQISPQTGIRFDYDFQLVEFLDMLREYGWDDSLDLEIINLEFENIEPIAITVNKGLYMGGRLIYDSANTFYRLGFIVIPYTEFKQNLNIK